MADSDTLVFRKPVWYIPLDVLAYGWAPVAVVVAIGRFGDIGKWAIPLGVVGLFLMGRSVLVRTLVTDAGTYTRTILFQRTTPLEHIVFAVKRAKHRPAYVVHRCGGGEVMGPAVSRGRFKLAWWDAHWGTKNVPLHDEPPLRSGYGKTKQCPNPRKVYWPIHWEYAVAGLYALVVWLAL